MGRLWRVLQIFLGVFLGLLIRNSFAGDQDEFYELGNGTGGLDFRIWNGVPTDLKFPWFVTFVAINLVQNRAELVCGGSLIGANAVVTAAHCVDGSNGFLDILDRKLDNGNIAYHLEAWLGLSFFKRPPKSYDVRIYKNQIHRHPSFTDPAPRNDIAIISVDSFGVHVTKPCIWTGGIDRLKVGLIGFGKYNCNMHPDKLNRATGTSYTPKDCTNLLQQFNNQVIPDGLVCAKLSTEYGPADQSNGDSGGPLYFTSDVKGVTKYRLVGLVSYNYGEPACPPNTNVPSVYTHVGYYSNWIRQYASDATYCDRLDHQNGG